MAGIGEAASVIAVIQISAQVISLCTNYYNGVRHAKDDIIRIKTSVESTQTVLHGIDELLCKTDAKSQLKITQQLSQALLACSLQLESLRSRLEPKTASKVMKLVGLRALMWPFKSKEVDRLVLELNNQRQILTSALQVDQTALLLENARKNDANYQNTDLSKLLIVTGASFDSHEEEHNAVCLPDTRTKLKEQIQNWATDRNGKSIYWLNGVAGTGKSTIARTMAQYFAGQSILGASFFFKRGAGDRGSASRFFTTIAWQLATRYPTLGIKIAESIGRDATILNKSFKEQLDNLILWPLNECCTGDVPGTLLIIVDALDECEREDDIRVIIQLLASVHHVRHVRSSRLRIFLTSRPELPIRLEIKTLPMSAHEDLILHEIPLDIVEHDIALFLRCEFKVIRDEFELDGDWPKESAVLQLARLAVPLFIFAATVCRYLRDPAHPPEKQLEYFLASTTNTRASGMDKTYLPILNQLLNAKTDVDQALLIKNFRETVGAIVLLASPLPKTSLATLLRITENDVSFRLRKLHSVLDIPSQAEQPIQLFHLSFRDFLLDPEKQGKSVFWINETETHHMLAERCIYLLQVTPFLKQDICNKQEPGIQRCHFTEAEIKQALPPEVQYACRYWVHHTITVSTTPNFLDLNNIYNFLSTQFLHWLEALSLIGCVRESIAMIEKLSTIPEIQTFTDLARFTYDAKRFILQNVSLIEQAPLQLYSSCMVFNPEDSIVRACFSKVIPKWIHQIPRMQKNWTPCLQTIEGRNEVNSVAFSSDGRKLAFVSDDTAVSLLNTSTGALYTTLEGHSKPVTTLAFSVDGKIASGSEDSTVKLWDASTGVLINTLKGHSDTVTSVAFSVDGKVASGSHDERIKLWNGSTGALLATLYGHSDSVLSVAFSVDGKLASGSQDSTVKLWDVSTGALLTTLRGHSRRVSSVAFSVDGKLASGSTDCTVKIWDASTGALLTILEGHSLRVSSVAFSVDGKIASGSIDNTVKIWNPSIKALYNMSERLFEYVMSVNFSPDGRIVASGSADQMIKLWDALTGKLLKSFEGYSSWIDFIIFSPDGRIVASGSYDNTIKLWDTSLGMHFVTLEGHSDSIRSMAFSPDGRILASGSYDKTIKLWDTSLGMHFVTLKGHSDSIHSMAFSPDGRMVASASADKTVILWNSSTGELVKIFEGHSEWVRLVVFSPDGRMIASGSADETVKLWNVLTGELLKTLKGHSDWIKSVTFSPDGRTVASGSRDNLIKLWDATTGQLLETIQTSRYQGNLSFTKDGYHLYSNKGHIRINSVRREALNEEHSLNPGIALQGSWITWKERKLLWLPMEYRTDATAVSDSRVAIGQESGQVAIIGLDLSVLAASCKF